MGSRSGASASGEGAVTLLRGNPHRYRAARYRYQPKRHHGRLGGREADTRDRSSFFDHLHDRRRGRSMALARRPQQHPSDKAVRASAACGSHLSATQRRWSSASISRLNWRPPVRRSCGPRKRAEARPRYQWTPRRSIARVHRATVSAASCRHPTSHISSQSNRAAADTR